MAKHKVDTNADNWTVGLELELSDWNCKLPIPAGCTRSPDYTIVNSNGIAAQPNIKHYAYGGEFNTPPTETIDGQLEIVDQLKDYYKELSVNYRSNLHVHIRVPGLKESLTHLKLLQGYIHDELPRVIDQVEPLILPGGDYGELYRRASHKRLKRMRVSHRTFLTPQRLAGQLTAKTVEEFFEAEVPKTKLGKPMWHAQPRVCVNLRQLLQTDTVEFRHFPGTLNIDELETAMGWCVAFLYGAFNNRSAEASLATVKGNIGYADFPKFKPFNLQLEIGYQATASHNGLKQDEILRNISLMQKGEFCGTEAENAATERACGN